MRHQFTFPTVREVLPPRPTSTAPPDRRRHVVSQRDLVAASLITCPPGRRG
jgi:hypothetical protein